jgi:predicted aspartyl protease
MKPDIWRPARQLCYYKSDQFFPREHRDGGINMERATMGRVVAQATIENLGDLFEVQRGLRTADQVRRITVSDALIDTGATTLALPARFIGQLGLTKRYEKRAVASSGKCTISVYEAVRLTILGRDCTVDAMEVPDDVPVLIGQIPLEMLDLVVDPQGRRLTGNPAHDGEQVLELY